MNPIIEGLDGRKMSSSWGNVVNIFDKPNDMYGKIMSLKDEYIIKYFMFTTRVPLVKIEEYKSMLKSGSNPRDIKMKLAFYLVNFYYSENDAKKAEDFFVNTFTKKEIPVDVKEFKPVDYNIVSFLVESKLVNSKSESRRVIEQGGVRVNGKIMKDLGYNLSSNEVVQKGKINFIKII